MNKEKGEPPYGLYIEWQVTLPEKSQIKKINMYPKDSAVSKKPIKKTVL